MEKNEIHLKKMSESLEKFLLSLYKLFEAYIVRVVHKCFKVRIKWLSDEVIYVKIPKYYEISTVVARCSLAMTRFSEQRTIF